MTSPACQLCDFDVEFQIFVARYLEYLDIPCFASCYLSDSDNSIFQRAYLQYSIRLAIQRRRFVLLLMGNE